MKQIAKDLFLLFGAPPAGGALGDRLALSKNGPVTMTVTLLPT